MVIVSKSDIGSKRKENQDNFWSTRLEVDGEEVGIVCVCDGMGGLDDGGLASSKVIRSLKKNILESYNIVDIPSILNVVSKSIHDMGKKMGTTCTILICSGGTYSIYHVGDSRCYIYREGNLSVLTTDHSALVKYGITKENNIKLWNKYKSSLTNCIGVKESATVDLYEGSYSEGDIFFVCSDGLWHYVEEKGITTEDLENLDLLIGKCIAYGETDNITVSVLKV